MLTSYENTRNMIATRTARHEKKRKNNYNAYIQAVAFIYQLTKLRVGSALSVH